MYTWMKSVKNISRSVRYPMRDKVDQDKKSARIEGMIFGGGLIDTGDKDSICEQFAFVLNNAGRRFRKGLNGEYPIQGHIRTISFSENEIAKNVPDGAEKALKITKDVMDNLAPDCLYMAVAQRDGKGGFWHVHIVQCAVHTSTLKAMGGRETNYEIFRKQAEHFAEKHGIELDSGKDHPKRKGKSESKKRHADAKEKTGYSWMQDLEKRIASAALVTTRMDDFEDNLQEAGVKVSRKTKSGWTYELAESEKKEWVGKKARYDRFSADMSNKTLRKLFDSNYKKLQMEKQSGNERRLPDVSSVVTQSEMERDRSYEG